MLRGRIMHLPESLSTTSEVQFLLAVLREIDNAKIRIPMFQREFVWRNKDIIELFNSIYNGYPIGSILLWETNDRSAELKQSNSFPFPVSKIHYPVCFIIDGVQR